MKPLILGVGNPWRGDDGIGPRAVAAIVRSGRDDVDAVVLDGEPARLAAAWRDRACVVVIDAIRGGAVPGTIHRVTDLDRIPHVATEASTHGGGVAAAVALGQALGELPGRLVVVGVEPAAVGHGVELSPEVAGALDDLIALVFEEVRGACV